MNFAFFTLAGLICFVVIWVFAADRKLEHRHFKILRFTGVPAYAIGIFSLIYTSAEGYLVTGVIFLALICFIFMSAAMFYQYKQITSREYTIMTLWGQCIFPIVIMVLPEYIRILT